MTKQITKEEQIENIANLLVFKVKQVEKIHLPVKLLSFYNIKPIV